MATSRKTIFLELADNLKLVTERVKYDRSPRVGKELPLDEFWPQFEACLKKVSSECTKLCLAFSSHPVPSSAGCCTFRETLENATLMLVSALYKLPSFQGTRLRNRVFDLVLDVVNSVRSLVVVVGEHAEARHQSALQCTGGVWEYCDSVDSIPKNAKQLTLEVIKTSLGLVKDALDEIEEEIKNETEGSDCEDTDEMEQDKWTNDDKQLLGPCAGIIKVAKSTLKKVHDSTKKNGNCGSPAEVADLEVICNRVEEVSPKVDDAIESLYPPVTKDLVFERIEMLRNTLLNLLSDCPGFHISSEDDQTWIDFLNKALDHNWTKLQSCM